MTIPEGNVIYTHGAPPCSGVGIELTASEFDTAIEGPVVNLLFDDEGTANIESILARLTETDFERERLAEILRAPAGVEDWRVGEAIAESYLTCHRNCYFPWPDERDERRRGSSLPGADLVGFCKDSEGDCFAFGEVKTSSEVRYPPQVMYGRTGLEQQLEDLRDEVSVRDGLLRYLGHRAINASWRSRFKLASKRYLRNKSDIQLYGVLIRDVLPDENDLRTRVQNLAQDCPNGTTIELMALYPPEGRITGIGQVVVMKRLGENS